MCALRLRTWGRTLEFCQALSDGVQHGLRPASDMQLTKDIAQAAFDRLLRDHQFLSNLFVRKAASQRLPHLLFARGQIGVGRLGLVLALRQFF